MKNRPQIGLRLERAFHLVAIAFSVAGAFLLRFDFSIPGNMSTVLRDAVLIAIAVKMLAFECTAFYSGLRRFVSMPDLYRLFVGNLVGSALFAAATRIWIGPAMPRSVWLIDALLCFVTTALVRFFDRIGNEAFHSNTVGEGRTGILIYGAGAAGAELVREIHSRRSTRYTIVGFLDDDPQKQNALILGVPVLGSGRQAAAVVRSLNRRRTAAGEIIVAIHAATGAQMREVLANCHAARVPYKTIPGIDELLSGKILSAQVRNPVVQDLLGRQPVQIDEGPASASIAGRTVLVTGAAGSIGSELCRQVARFAPACLVALDQGESELFRIENELRERFPDLELVTALGDIRDPDRLAEVFSRQRVDSVFHAAAYKHVPMMESHVLEAVRNNILGTWNVVHAACDANVSSFLMISSDKAVNPTCIMGATKRICERIVSARRSDREETKCVAVRFGNVLGSNGSVVPIFQQQIAAGGPVKVTHPDARRFFMTISEAVSLVVQASARSEGSEIFVLDMGEPIRILDLAENMIRLANLVPYEDIDIQFTGLRPGEKLVEEVYAANGCLAPTPHTKIRVIREEPLRWEQIAGWVEKLEELLEARQQPDVIAHIRQFVPEYNPAVHSIGKVTPIPPARALKTMQPILWSNGTERQSKPSPLMAGKEAI